VPPQIVDDATITTRAQKANKNWESSEVDLDSIEEELLSQEDAASGSHAHTGKRAMAEDKLQEKRLKERARRNGMATSIDEMRVIVPELIDAKKNYSQAKVVALALAHMHELQRENEQLRQKLGMRPMLDDFRERSKMVGKSKKDRSPPSSSGGSTRGRKRRRVEDGPAKPGSGPAPSVTVPAPTTMAKAAPKPAPLVSLKAEPMEPIITDDNDDDSIEPVFVAESLVGSPALSPHQQEEFPAPFAPNFGNFESFEAHRPHAMDWAPEHDHVDVFASHSDYYAPRMHFEGFLESANMH